MVGRREAWKFDTPFVSTDYRRTSRNNRVLGWSCLVQGIILFMACNHFKKSDSIKRFILGNGLGIFSKTPNVRKKSNVPNKIAASWLWSSHFHQNSSVESLCFFGWFLIKMDRVLVFRDDWPTKFSWVRFTRRISGFLLLSLFAR